jgi:hypothetical protein
MRHDAILFWKYAHLAFFKSAKSLISNELHNLTKKNFQPFYA